MQKMQFDPLKDFTFIVCLTGYTFGLVVRADSPIKTIKDLVELRQGQSRASSPTARPATAPRRTWPVEEFASRPASS